MMKKLINEIRSAEDNEYGRAIGNHGLFETYEEAFNTLNEEIWEMEQEYEYVKTHIDSVLHDIHVRVLDDITIEYIERLDDKIQNMAAEAVQVAAVLRKIKASKSELE